MLATIKVLAVVIGHVLGVIAAHDRAVRILPPRHQLTGQLPLLFAMVAFTIGGLYLLFAPDSRTTGRPGLVLGAYRKAPSPAVAS